ncbi:MAG: hypothetical protein ACI35W_00590 [Anaeroplasmataceae bacterium]
MKKIISIFTLFIFLILIKSSYASTYSFVWENTYIKIPLGESLYDYINIPQATLYENGVKTDHEVYYLRGDMSTCEENIDTSKIGIYYLAYCAISDIEEYVIVTFEVVDNIPPIIENIAPLKISSKPDYNNFFNITDNYSEVTIKYNDDNIDYNTPGEYILIVSATDCDNNTTTESFKVIVVDNIPPSIEAIRELELEVNTAFNPLDYFKAYDSVLGDVSNTITCSGFDNATLGMKNITIFCHDSTNFYSQNFSINVVDKTSPIIKLKTDILSITIGDVLNLDKSIFLNNIDEVSDNYNVLDYTDVDIKYDSLKAVVGEYEIYYSLVDKSGNESSIKAMVNVLCDSVPEIEVKNIYINVGDSIDYYNYISAYDKYDGDITYNIEIDDSNVNTNKKGVYFVELVVKNSSNKYNYKTLVVYVNESFIASYYWVFLIPLGIIGIIVFFIIKKKKSVI